VESAPVDLAAAVALRRGDVDDRKRHVEDL
jgi:hypothetical protein